MNSILSIFHRGSSGPNGAPSNLVLTVINDTSVRLDWTNGATNQTGTRIYLSTEGGSYAVNSTALGSLTTKTVTGLTANTNYAFKIVHYKGSIESAISNIVWDTTFPSIIFDGNSVMIIDGGGTALMTKDASNRVQQINDKSGTDHHLIQNTEANRPVWNMVEGFRTDGVSDFIQTADFDFNQPVYHYALLNQISFTDGKRILDSGPSSSAAVIVEQTTSAGRIRSFAGSYSSAITGANLGGNYILRAFFNGASSKLALGSLSPVTGNLGANNPDGITLGAVRTGVAAFSNIEFKCWIARKAADNSTIEEAIVAHIQKRYLDGRLVNMVWEGHSMINTAEAEGDICVTDYAESKLYYDHSIKLRHSFNVAVGGSTIDHMTARYASAVTANKSIVAGVVNYLTIFIGCNDIHGGETGASAYNALHSYVDQAITDGWIPIIITMTNYADDATTQRDIFNASIKGNADWDYIVDVDAIPELTDNTDTTYYNADKIHLVSAGSERLANALYQKIYQAIQDNTP